MKRGYEMALSLVMAFVMIATVFFVTPVTAEDQAQSRMELMKNTPTNVTFYDVAWNENTWNYAIAVGENTSSGNGVVYRFEYAWTNGKATPEWTEITNGTKAGEVYMDVVYDTASNTDTFYYVGKKTGAPDSAVVYKLDGATGQVTDLNVVGSISAAKSFNGACFDPSYGNKGALVLVGNDTSDNGLIAYYDFYLNTWKYNITGSGDVLEAVTWSPYSGNIYIVGYNNKVGIAYSYDYQKATIISAPPNAGAFYGIDWQPSVANGYGIVVGIDTSGRGFAWRLFENGNFANLAGINQEAPALRDVAWKNDSSMAIIVGDAGATYVYYSSQAGKVMDWSEPSVIDADLYGIAVKSPGSPGYGLAVGVSSTLKISYQVSDTSTQITVNTVYPHLNAIDFRDSSGTSRLNQQVDVGSTYYFFINASYSEGWGNVELDIYAWYDNGNDSSNYNNTPGANLNFHLHYTPNATDPVNNSGTWTLLWPTHGEVSYVNSQQYVVNKANSTNATGPDAQDYFHLYVNISFAEQVRYAPGDGTWDASTNQSDSSASFNDLNSWNFDIRIYDSSNPSAKQDRYDEFGIFSYTQVSASGNPAGTGPPGSLIVLSPNSTVVIKANRDYYVTVNVTDLTSTTGGSAIIPRANISVQNSHPDNSTAPTQIRTWTPFNITGALWLWGDPSSGPTYMPPMDNGTFTAGYEYGWDSSINTQVSWRVSVPPTIPEDHFAATITYEISYP